jgi:sterol desaturase/sphingolipid hydroxylase (fatty acid hydroxylase superfamily)
MQEYLSLPVLDGVGFYILVGAVIIFFSLEFLIPLREWRYNRKQRIRQNILLSIIGMPMARLLLLPLTFLWAGFLKQQNFGLINWLELPAWAGFVVGVLALDYGIYLWHRLNHISPFLWRFHNVHHLDLDMDVSTGIRFHFGEMLLSIPFRILVIALAGVQPLTIVIYEVIFEVATLFHHSNIKLPKGLEKALAYFIITPKQHGIHHSVVQNESNSNYGTVFNFWDRLHGSSIMNVKQQKVNIGVPAYRSEEELNLGFLLKLPVLKQRAWHFPDNSIPTRDKEELSTKKLE